MKSVPSWRAAVAALCLLVAPSVILTSGTRDLLLSNTVRVHRKLRNLGIDSFLQVYEGQSHAQYGRDDRIPEVREAFGEIGYFFDKHLGKRADWAGAASGAGNGHLRGPRLERQHRDRQGAVLAARSADEQVHVAEDRIGHARDGGELLVAQPGPRGGQVHARRE